MACTRSQIEQQHGHSARLLNSTRAVAFQVAIAVAGNGYTRKRERHRCGEQHGDGSNQSQQIAPHELVPELAQLDQFITAINARKPETISKQTRPPRRRNRISPLALSCLDGDSPPAPHPQCRRSKPPCNERGGFSILAKHCRAALCRLTHVERPTDFL
jgi:hypothetical protein